MDSAQQAAAAALSSVNQLLGMHDSFVAELGRTTNRAPIIEIGSLVVTNKSITCDCLNRTIVVSHRPEAVGGRVCAMEYDFSVEWKGEKLSILQMFLQPNGIISRDAKGDSKFQDFNGADIKNHILAAVSFALVNSPVFTPLQG